MELLGTYSTARINTNSYNLTFSFPDNCNAIVSHKDGVYSVAINLNKGQTQPSSNYITDNIICNQYNGCIEIQFVQQNFNPIGGDWGDGNSTKPKVKIFVNG
ncbi:hypothetical protein M0M57_01465 [Flavobacterium azooxidireducens]|uniref:Uncharacterized protein n=1 Tax=Flavobacterium azooxidireducens TaxID=1871076 RepID=A0ABY4KFP4_9FLAO|nr:hypothetical protein [Flavobacterium azooxidireducens]UPQ79519.1 hypothetical protein M0M57_01465 [Flavobacterium azooxidireducens]